MFLRALLAFCAVMVCQAGISSAAVSPDWDPVSFTTCLWQRDTLADLMFATFDLDGDGSVRFELIECIWDRTSVVTPFCKSELPDGVDDIRVYCDANSDGTLTYDEVLDTHTCVGNCETATSLGFFYNQAHTNRSWINICAYLG